MAHGYGSTNGSNLMLENISIVDFRSDTITKPDDEMRAAMASAAVGDDVYKEDPTVNELERRAAEMLGKDAALYVPSGTMSNLIALLCHCKARGSEAFVGDESHILHYEQTGAAQFGGVNLRSIKTYPDGSIDLKEIKSKVRDSSDFHQSISVLICLENTHNRCGGRIVPQDFVTEVGEFARSKSLKLHLDGARLFNAAVAQGKSAAELAEPFDSVSICLSKGLGAPVGSLLLGNKSFIADASRCRKALGGGMRQAGIIAAAGLLALQKGPDRMKDDHRRAKYLAEKIKEYGEGIVNVDLSTVETNILMVQVLPNEYSYTPSDLVSRLSIVTNEEVDQLKISIKVLAYAMTAVNVRIVTHCNLQDEDISLAITKLKFVFEEFKHLRSNFGAIKADAKRVKTE